MFSNNMMFSIIQSNNKMKFIGQNLENKVIDRQRNNYKLKEKNYSSS